MENATRTDQRHTRIDHAKPHHADVVLVDWMLGNACSFACSYCPASLHDGSVAWQDRGAVLELFDTIKAHYADGMGRKVWIQFTGGEPTMYPRIVELLQEATARGFAISLISNASRTIRFWETICDHLDSAILTYHDEFVEHGHFLEIGAMLCETMPVHVNVTMHPDRFDATFARAAEIGEAMPEATISLKPLREGFRSALYPYSPAQLRLLETRLTRPRSSKAATPRGVMTATAPDGRQETLRANSFILNGTNTWRGYSCNAGLESLRVKGDGTITRAVCGNAGIIGKLGEQVNLPSAPTICEKDACSCVADILITKSR